MRCSVKQVNYVELYRMLRGLSDIQRIRTLQLCLHQCWLS